MAHIEDPEWFLPPVQALIERIEAQQQ